MSYILDALRKSEQQRQRGKIPNLGGGGEPPPKRHRGGLLRLFVVLLVLNAGLLAWWLLRSPSEPSQPQPQVALQPQEELKLSVPLPSNTPAAPVPPPARAPQPIEAVSSTPGDSGALPVPASATEVDEDATVMVVGGQEVRVTVSDAMSGEQAAGQIEPPVAARPVEMTFPPAVEPASEPNESDTGSTLADSVQSDESLPRYLLREVPDGYPVPEFEVTLHFYTDEVSSRMVRLNGRLLREGDQVDDRWRLSEISPEGVVLGGTDFELFLERP